MTSVSPLGNPPILETQIFQRKYRTSLVLLFALALGSPLFSSKAIAAAASDRGQIFFSHTLEGTCAKRPDSVTLAQCMGDPLLKEKLDSITKSEETFNTARLLHLGMNSLPVRIQLIKEAQNYIFISSLNWDHDSAGNLLGSLIESRMAELPNLDFRFLHDWFYPFEKGFPKLGKWVKQMREGGEYLAWNSPAWLRRFSYFITANHMHDKMFIVDGRRMLIGGMNMAAPYLEGGTNEDGWHDTDLFLDGPAAQQAATYFIKAWELGKYLQSAADFPPFKKLEIKTIRDYFYKNVENFSFNLVNPNFGRDSSEPPQITLKGTLPIFSYLRDPKYFPPIEKAPEETPDKNVGVRIIYDNPLVDRDEKTGRHFSKTIHTVEFLTMNSKKRALFFMPYLALSNHVINILKHAAKRINVTVVTNSIDTHDEGQYAYSTAVADYPELIDAGVNLYEWHGHAPLKKFEQEHNCKIETGQWPGHTIHTKMAIFDDSMFMIGSNNMDVRSEHYNNESMALVRSDELAHQAVQIFTNDEDSKEEVQIKCGGKFFQRPPLLERITKERAEELRKLYPPSRFRKLLKRFI